MKQDGSGKRYNKGKTRVELAPAFAQEQYARVLTIGAEKYGDHNWCRGMKWSSVLASLERHLLAIKNGDDYDEETGLLHSAHIMCNAAFLTEYYKIYPQGDDRAHKYLNNQKIGLDIDEVLSSFIEHYNSYYGEEIVPEMWNFCKNMPEKMKHLESNKDFWITMPVKTNPKDIPFEPHCYITSRNIPIEWTEEWIKNSGFPTAPVYSVGFNNSKAETVKNCGVDIFVDDGFENFVELNNAGVFCYLFDAPHNKRYNVGHKRIYNLKILV